MCRDVFCGWDVVPRHEIFCKRLARFHLGRVFARADYLEAASFKFVDDAKGQRRLAADKGHINCIPGRELDQACNIGRLDRHTLCDLRDPRVAIGTEHLRDLARASKTLTDRMLTTTRTDY